MADGDGVHPTADGYAIVARLIGAHTAWRDLIERK
jgi:lysophospholipase L1-like esterase